MLNAEARTIALSTGTVRVTVESAAWPLDRLCGFAARNNPKRGFLVVSKVLGRHIPARPQVMRAAVRDLAAQVPADLAGPVMVVGLAETAVCLGQTLHSELRVQTGRDDIAFLHSTRQQVDHPLLCRFEEPHSHASAHLVYRPDGIDVPRTLVVVDDEISTGTTLANLTTALVAQWPQVERIVVATLTDWSGDGAWMARMPRPTTRVRLLAGRLDWTPADTVMPTDLFEGFDTAAASLGRMTDAVNYGRLGTVAVVETMPPALPPILGGEALRIVGTGEFTWAPFRLAERMAAAGHDVVVQATSRSPARIGGAIGSALMFRDNYDTGVPNYLYNADPADGRTTWICHETPAGSIDPTLIAALDARTIDWKDPA